MNAPFSETERLAALERCRILDSPPEECFDRICRLAARIFHAPCAIVSFVTQDRSWIKSRYGLQAAEFQRTASFCTHTILNGSPLVVPDATHDPRFARLPIVTDPPGIRFYAGVALTTCDGWAVGTLAVMDTRPRKTCPTLQISALRDLAAILVDELNRRSSQRTETEDVLTWNPPAESRMKQAEPAIREAGERLRLAQDATRIGTWDWRVPEAIILCSDRFLRLHGLPPRDSPMPFAQWLASVHPEDHDRILLYSKDLLKLAEQARSESERQYAGLFRTINHGVMYLNDRGVILSVNPAAERILGLPAGQMCGRRPSDLDWKTTTEDGAPLPTEKFPGSISLHTGSEVQGAKTRIWNPQRQEYRWLSIDTIRQLLPGETQPYQLCAIFQDITASVHALNRLRASEERLRLLIEHGLEVIAILDPPSTIRYVSPSAERVFGYPADSLPGTNVLDYAHPDDQHLVRQALHQVASSPGGTTAVHFRVRHHDGTWRHAEGSATNCLQIEGLCGLVANLRDITAQKVFEEQLQASRHQLRQLSAHIESAREEERIRIAREVHDELGQILTALKLDLEGIPLHHRRDSSPALRKALAGQIANAVRMVDLAVNTVRRISAELRPSILAHLGLSAALKWQIQEFQARTGIPCHCRLLRRDPPIGAEPSTAVFRAFQEILTNIVRHANAKTVRVELRTGSGWLTLRVSDDGRGLDPKHLSDPNALGLLGIRERALLVGGRADFTRRRGGGTVVTISIPTAQPPVVIIDTD